MSPTSLATPSAQTTRWGDWAGTRFLIVMEDIRHLDEIVSTVQRITRVLSTTFCVEQHEIRASGSIGIAVFPDDGEDSDTLMRQADLAMYVAKNSGGARWNFFAREMSERIEHQLRLESDLGNAISREELLLHYQPKVDALTGTLAGAEALLRWRRGDKVIPAAGFICWYSKRRFPAGFEWKRLEDFSSYSLGVVRGYSYGDEVDQALQKGELKATEVNTVDQLFTMLAGDRVDLALANDGVGFALARQHTKAQVVAANMATGEDVLYMAFSRRSEARRLIPQINEILAELRGQGVVERTIRGGH